LPSKILSSERHPFFIQLQKIPSFLPRPHPHSNTAAMSIPRRALIAITSAHAELFEGGGHTTGVFIGEALHPYNVFKAAGFEVDIVSEKGTWTEDWLSLQPGFLSTEEREQYDDKNSEFRKDMDSNIKAADVLEKEVSSRRVCRIPPVSDLVPSTACSSHPQDTQP
jgi:hypothetical protein